MRPSLRLIETPSEPATEARPAVLTPATPSWIMIRLALETRAHHGIADAQRLALIDDATPATYRAFLAMVFGFESAYEQALVLAPELDPRIMRDRAKTERLRRDLRALGLDDSDLAALPRCPSIPRFRSAAHALGWIYVIERNTLLHNLLRRHLAVVLPSVVDRASAYLGAYAATPGERYRELAPDLEAVARQALTPGQLVEAAHEAFVAQRTWFAAARYAALAS